MLFLLCNLRESNTHRRWIAPLHHWESQNVPSTGTFYLNDSSSGPARTERISARLQPFSPASRAHGNDRRNAESPLVGFTATQPTWGIKPEMAADADTTRRLTEEKEIPVSYFYRPHILCVTDRSCDVRHPSGLGFPKAKVNPVKAERWHRVTAVSCVAW